MQEKLYMAAYLALTPDTKKAYQVRPVDYLFAFDQADAISKALHGRGRSRATHVFVAEVFAKIDLEEQRREKKAAKRKHGR
jgi:hypothetical protein